MSKRFLSLKLLALCALAAAVGTSLAQDEMEVGVKVRDQVTTEHHVMVGEVVMDMPGFIVIHAATPEGTVGPVIGHRAVNVGAAYNIAVPIDLKATTST